MRKEKIEYLLKMSKTQNNSWTVAWLRCIAGALYLEDILPDVSEMKPIMSNIPELPKLDTEEVQKWALETYDVYHPLRNNVELIDSIESVRLYLKENGVWVGNIFDSNN